MRSFQGDWPALAANLVNVGSRLPQIGVSLAGAALTGWLGVAFLGRDLDSAVAITMVLMGPAWAYAFCLASRDEDFPEDAWHDRDGWLRLLPWTFVLAPLAIPATLLLIQFFRDSRADHGQTMLGSGRSRPGDGTQEMLR